MPKMPSEAGVAFVLDDLLEGGRTMSVQVSANKIITLCVQGGRLAWTGAFLLDSEDVDALCSELQKAKRLVQYGRPAYNPDGNKESSRRG